MAACVGLRARSHATTVHCSGASIPRLCSSPFSRPRHWQSRSLSQTACLADAAMQRRWHPCSWQPPSLPRSGLPQGLQRRHRGCRQVTRMGNKSAGPFTPVVVVVRDRIGTKSFNQLRGKAISLHSQVIKTFGKQIGAEAKQVQGLIRLAKSNGEKLGFLS